MTHKCVSVRLGVYCRMLVALFYRVLFSTCREDGLHILCWSRLLADFLCHASLKNICYRSPPLSLVHCVLQQRIENNKNMKWNDFNQETQLEKLKFLSVWCHRLPVSSGLGKKTGRSQFWLMMAKDIIAEMRISFFLTRTIEGRRKPVGIRKRTNMRERESSHQLQLIKSFSCW